MSRDITLSMVNTRGRVVWVEEDKVIKLRQEGWRVIVNPKENYYPQYDQSLIKVKEDEIGDSTKVFDNDAYKNTLGIIII